MQHKKCLSVEQATWYKSDQYCTGTNILSANELLWPTIQWIIIIEWKLDHATQYNNKQEIPAKLTRRRESYQWTKDKQQAKEH